MIKVKAYTRLGKLENDNNLEPIHLKLDGTKLICSTKNEEGGGIDDDYLKSSVSLNLTSMKNYTRYQVFRCANYYIMSNFKEDGTVITTSFFNKYFTFVQNSLDHRLNIFKTEEDEIFILSFLDIQSTNIPFSAEPSKTFSEIVRLNSADPNAYTKYIQQDEIWQARFKLEDNLRPMSSLSYMDVQVDMLLNITKSILDSYPELKTKIETEHPEYITLLDLMLTYDISKIKSSDEMIESITRKKKAREAQVEYYNSVIQACNDSSSSV